MTVPERTEIIKEREIGQMTEAELRTARTSVRRVLNGIERRLSEPSETDSSGTVSREQARQILKGMRGG